MAISMCLFERGHVFRLKGRVDIIRLMATVGSVQASVLIAVFFFYKRPVWEMHPERSTCTLRAYQVKTKYMPA